MVCQFLYNLSGPEFADNLFSDISKMLLSQSNAFLGDASRVQRNPENPCHIRAVGQGCHRTLSEKRAFVCWDYTERTEKTVTAKVAELLQSCCRSCVQLSTGKWWPEARRLLLKMGFLAVSKAKTVSTGHQVFVSISNGISKHIFGATRYGQRSLLLYSSSEILVF